MQTVNQSVEIVSYVTNVPRSRAAQIARALLNAELLPKSNGRDVKKIDGAQLLLLLAAVAMTDKAVDAAKVAAEFASLPAVIAADGEESIMLPQWFAKALAMPNGAVDVEFAKVKTGYTAHLNHYFQDDDGETKSFALPFWKTATWGHFCKSSFTLSREGFEVLRNLFVREDIEGMGFTLNTKDAE